MPADRTLAAPAKKPVALPPAAYAIGLVLVLGLAGFWYLNRKSHEPPPPPPPLTGAAKAYVRYLKLSEVDMAAHESYMKQQIVEITGKIGNTGDRVIEQIVLNCVFRDAYGQVVLRERVPIVEQEDGRPGAQRCEGLPHALRQYSGELEPGAARPGDRGDRLFVRARFALLAGLLPLLAGAQPVTPVEPALAEIAATRWQQQAAVSPDGSRLAYVNVAAAGKSEIFLAGFSGGQPVRLTAGTAPCEEHGVAWSPDSRQIAFLSDCQKEGQLQLYVAPAGGGKPRALTHLTGLLAEPHWSPDGKRIALLFTENLPRAAGPLDPVLPVTGVAESKIYEQRLAVVEVAGGTARQISPADFYIYEYDWSPDGAGFAVTASRGAGDDNWWIAQLYTLSADGSQWKAVYKPPVERQLAVPRWTPGGRSIVFIGGLMSDEGSTGGEIFQVPASGGEARSLTPGIHSSVSSLVWARAARQLYFTEHYDGGSAISKLDPATGQVERLWQGDESINPPFEDSGISLSDDGKTSAVIRSSWRAAPEVWAGRIGEWSQQTRANAGRKPLWGEAKNLHWTSDGFRVQGWLLYPLNFDANRRYPMVVTVHGGPASSLKPAWPRPGFNPTLLSQQGYFVLMPNPRGSYGQDEKFTMANVKDFGGGDLRDILAGVDEAVKTAPIDPQRVGHHRLELRRVHDHVGGDSDQPLPRRGGRGRHRQLEKLLRPKRHRSVDDPLLRGHRLRRPGGVCQKLGHRLHQAGEDAHAGGGGRSGDGECPPPQSFEFWHALKTLGVKTELVVYPDEGHRFSKPDDQRDVLVRMIRWFNENLR